MFASSDSELLDEDEDLQEDEEIKVNPICQKMIRYVGGIG